MLVLLTVMEIGIALSCGQVLSAYLAVSFTPVTPLVTKLRIAPKNSPTFHQRIGTVAKPQ